MGSGYAPASVVVGEFAAGERVTVSIGTPSGGTITGTTLSVRALSLEIAPAVTSGSFPDDLDHTITEDGWYVLTAELQGDDSAQATFEWSCGIDSAPGFPQTGDKFGEYVSEIARSGGMGNDGYKPGSHRGFAKAIHDNES
jgi:hypothetical protein